MKESNLHQVFLMLTFCLTTIGGCTGRPDPLQKAFDAVGGQEALLELRGFGYESAGERFETAQGLNPETYTRASTFDLSLQYDVENDRLSFDWRRQVFGPLPGETAYRDIVDGALGYQIGDWRVNPTPRPDARALLPEHIAAVQREFRLLNPLLYLRTAAMTEGAGTVKDDVEHDGRPHHVIEVSDPTYPVELIVDAESGQVSMLRTMQNDYIWGDVEIEVSYGDWSSPEGSSLKFPHRVELALSGNTLHAESRTDVVVNPEFAADAFALPEEPRTQVDPEAAQRGALTAQFHTRYQAIGIPNDRDQPSTIATAVAGDPEIQYVTGGSHNSLAMRFGDGVIVLEAPLNELRSKAVLAQIDELWPGLPVTHVFITHHHFDHMGGIRTYAGRGATIVTSALNSAYVERALNSLHTLLPDELAGVESPEWQIETVAPGSEFKLEADGRTVIARHVPSVHAEPNLVFYIPESQVLFVGDILLPAAGQPYWAPFDAWLQGLRETLPTLDWEVAWIGGGHGRMGSIANFYSGFDG